MNLTNEEMLNCILRRISDNEEMTNGELRSALVFVVQEWKHLSRLVDELRSFSPASPEYDPDLYLRLCKHSRDYDK